MADSTTWSALLFLPANRPDRAGKAVRTGADAVIVDLEDAVPAPDRAEARISVRQTIRALHAAGSGTCVRVNAGLRDQVRDLEAAVDDGLDAIMLPRAEDTGDIAATASILDSLERERGLCPGQIRIIALIETARGVMAARTIAAASPRVCGLALGPEDLALDLGVEPVAETLTEPLRQLIWAARAQGLSVFGHVESIALIEAVDRLEASLATAARLGVDGALCIHPAQIVAVHRAFAVSEATRAWAERVVAVAGGRDGVSAVDGEMVDRPVLERAERILRRHAARRS